MIRCILSTTVSLKDCGDRQQGVEKLEFVASAMVLFVFSRHGETTTAEATYDSIHAANCYYYVIGKCNFKEVEMSDIFLFGLGFLMGYLFSIKSLDMVYKEKMKAAIDEIHRQYKRALGRKDERPHLSGGTEKN